MFYMRFFILSSIIIVVSLIALTGVCGESVQVKLKELKDSRMNYLRAKVILLQETNKKLKSENRQLKEQLMQRDKKMRT